MHATTRYGSMLSFYLTYEGLKHGCTATFLKSSKRFYLTYEGLKPHYMNNIRPLLTDRFYLTYEGSKRFRLNPFNKAANQVCILPMRDRNVGTISPNWFSSSCLYLTYEGSKLPAGV